jgi:antitoxin component of MazEF toxin-antitoxin module
LARTIGSGLGEVTTITYARPNSQSLRVTVPQGIAKHFNLKEGDRLDWTIEARDSKLVIIITPKRRERRQGS